MLGGPAHCHDPLHMDPSRMVCHLQQDHRMEHSCTHVNVALTKLHYDVFSSSVCHLLNFLFDLNKSVCQSRRSFLARVCISVKLLSDLSVFIS